MEHLADHHNKFEWQKPFYEALAEANPEKLTEKVAEAEGAIFPKVSITGTELRRSGGATRAARCLEYSTGSEERDPQVPVWENSVSFAQ